MPTLTPQQFVSTWRNNTLKERSAAQEHFIGLCRLLDHPTPAEHDSDGTSFTFEAGADKTAGGEGFADVWKRGSFAWEYKGKHANLDKAYQQLLQYRESLENPPLLIVSDLDRIVVHTNFTGTAKKIVTLTLDDLLTREGMETLRAIFFDPQSFRTSQTTQQVTEKAAEEFARLSDALRTRGTDAHDAAHFLIRILFSLFAEDAGVIARGLFTRIVENGRRDPKAFKSMLGDLFEKMAVGGHFGAERIPHFNGRLFDNAKVIELDRDAIEILYHVSALDWASIEPSIFGTLFERSLDPTKRAQLGVQYTSRSDILLIVEPVLIEPLRREWLTIRREVDELVGKWKENPTGSKSAATGYFNRAVVRLQQFSRRLAEIIVLDPACGSGNFLYVALRLLLDLEKEVIAYAGTFGATSWFPHVSPAQLRGIEKDEYAHELAQATVWIGYIQWLTENGFGIPPEPILRAMNSIERKDAVLTYDENGNAVEPAWPSATTIVGNPPFLGGKRLRSELGSKYVNDLFTVYSGRVAPEADLVCYWYEKARRQIEVGTAERAGLIATNSIRGGANRKVLERVISSGSIFMAWADRPWIINGAAVRVSIVGFDNGSETTRTLDGLAVDVIHSDLTTGSNITQALRLRENAGISFMGDTKGGAFDIEEQVALEILRQTGNPNGRPNTGVVRPWANGLDVTRRPRGMWIIDFGEMSMDEAAQYDAPFAHIMKAVYPTRQKNNRAAYRNLWWIHAEPRPAMSRALVGKTRFIVTPTVARHRLFAWLPFGTVPDHQLIVFARDDDYFFGVLQARPHEVWALRAGTSLGVGNDPRYTPTSTFETYPFPWPPGKEPIDDPRVVAVSQAAKELVEKRERWLNPSNATEPDLRKRTLTNLYNERPMWLDLAHKELDAQVVACYGWPPDVTDDELLARLLILNRERSMT